MEAARVVSVLLAERLAVLVVGAAGRKAAVGAGGPDVDWCVGWCCGPKGCCWRRLVGLCACVGWCCGPQGCCWRWCAWVLRAERLLLAPAQVGVCVEDSGLFSVPLMIRSPRCAEGHGPWLCGGHGLANDRTIKALPKTHAGPPGLSGALIWWKPWQNIEVWSTLMGECRYPVRNS